MAIKGKYDRSPKNKKSHTTKKEKRYASTFGKKRVSMPAAGVADRIAKGKSLATMLRKGSSIQQQNLLLSSP